MNWHDEIHEEIAKNWHEWTLATIGSCCVLFRRKVADFLSWLWRKLNASAIAIDGLTKLISEIKPTLEALQKAVENQYKTSEEAESQSAICMSMANVLLAYHKTPTWICDQSGQCIFANGALCELFCLDEAEMMGSGWTRAIDADDILNVQSVWDTFRDHPDRQYKSRYRIIRHGSRLTVDASGSAIKTRGGRVAGFIGKVEPLPAFNACST